MPKAFDAGSLASRIAAALCALSVAACGGQRLTQTGFLDDYDRLHPQPDHQDDAIYVKPGFSAAGYSKVIIQPVEWVPAKQAPQREPATIATLQGNFHDALAASLSKRFTVIQDPGEGVDPGPGVLRVRSAITNTRRALWWVNVPAQAAQIAVGSLGFLRPSAGGASEEIEVRDAGTHEPVVAIATYNNGLPYNFVGSYLEYGHARRAFRIAADLTRDELVQGSPAPAQVAAAGLPSDRGHVAARVASR